MYSKVKGLYYSSPALSFPKVLLHFFSKFCISLCMHFYSFFLQINKCGFGHFYYLFDRPPKGYTLHPPKFYCVYKPCDLPYSPLSSIVVKPSIYAMYVQRVAHSADPSVFFPASFLESIKTSISVSLESCFNVSSLFCCDASSLSSSFSITDSSSSSSSNSSSSSSSSGSSSSSLSEGSSAPGVSSSVSRSSDFFVNSFPQLDSCFFFPQVSASKSLLRPFRTSLDSISPIGP